MESKKRIVSDRYAPDRYVPQKGQKYWAITNFKILQYTSTDDYFDQVMCNFGNCFKYKKDAWKVFRKFQKNFREIDSKRDEIVVYIDNVQFTFFLKK